MGKKVNKRLLAVFLSVCMLMGILAGCGNTDGSGGSTGTSVEIETEKNGTSGTSGYTEDSEASSEDASDINGWRTIKSGQVYQNAVVSGTDNLYQMDIGNDAEGIYIYDLFTVGDKIVIFYNQNESNMLAMYDLTSLEQTALLELGPDIYIGDIFTNGTDRIAVYNANERRIQFYDSDLKGTNQNYMLDGAPTSYVMSEDLSLFIYTESDDGKIYGYDLENDAVSEACPSFPGGDSMATITGFLESPAAVLVSTYNEAEERGENTFYRLWEDSDYELEDTGILQFSSVDSRYYTVVTENGSMEQYQVFGTSANENPEILFVKDQSYQMLGCDLKSELAVYGKIVQSVSEEKQEVSLKVYDLTDGTCRNEGSASFPYGDGNAMFLDKAIYIESYNLVLFSVSGDTNEIYLWDLNEESSKSTDTASSFYPWEYLTEPDETVKNELKNQAAEIGDENGVEVYIFEEVSECPPDMYRYEVTDNAILTAMALNTLEEELAKYPDNMLAELDDVGSPLKIYLADAIIGIDESALSTAAGLQNTYGNTAYLVLDINNGYETYRSTIHHELFHAIEVHLINCGYWFTDEEWSACNPDGFYYDYDYVANEGNFDYTYVVGDTEQPEETAFIDTYSKSFPNEDRARIFEMAMTDTENKLGYFNYENILKKLKVMDDKMRACFPSDTWQAVTEWEKVLQE